MKTVLITGASQGIGAATAEAFWEAGWHVGLLARSRNKLDTLAKDRAATVLEADVTDEAAVDAAFAEFADAVGRLDVLFNNAGMFGPSGPLDEIPLDGWKQVMDVNINGMFLAARAAFRQMRVQNPQGGRIINNGSLSAHVPREGSAAYSTSKHAISGLTKTISLDGRPFDIACGQIDIGNARTAMVEDLNERRAREGLSVLPSMDVKAAADAVVHMAGLPHEANVQTLTVMATKMPFIGRG
ncbi:MAG: SDR family oxidoreductase [Pseudomonadota bacterium]